jgi:hypothetical protein
MSIKFRFECDNCSVFTPDVVIGNNGILDNDRTYSNRTLLVPFDLPVGWTNNDRTTLCDKCSAKLVLAESKQSNNQ